MGSLVIVGAGGFGRETLDAVLASGRTPTAFLDDHRAGETVRGLQVRLPSEGVRGDEYLVAIADPVARRRLAAQLDAAGLRAATVVHPRATIAPECDMGVGCIVLAHAYVSSSTRLGDHVQINYNATVGHDAVLDDFVTVYPGANVSGAVHLESGVTLGSNSCVIQGRRVRARTFVGAGAVVVHDVGPDLVVKGVPAR